MLELLQNTKEICRIFDIKPSYSKGQNFLVSELIYNDIINSADIKDNDVIVEIGPGLGFLTAKLVQKAKKVIAIEIDNKLVQVLQTAIDTQEVDNVEIVNTDVLKFNFENIKRPYKIVANLPYSITSIFLRQILSLDNRPQEIVLMLQKEVVERILANPPKMNVLAISVQLSAQVELVKEVKANNFWPQPKVDSAIIKIIPGRRMFNKVEEKLFWRLVKAGFSAKRKMLKNNLKSLNISDDIIIKILQQSNLENNVRAENLSLLNWQVLFAKLKNYMV